MVQQILYIKNLFVSDLMQSLLFGQVLSYQPIMIFIQSSLP